VYYYTEVKEDGEVVRDDELAPPVFENDRLVGWGWGFMDEKPRKDK
jgi:hypothetical protein